MSKSGTKELCQSRPEGLLIELNPSETEIGGSQGRKLSVEAFVGFWILLMKSQCSLDGKNRKAQVPKRLPESIGLPVRYLKQYEKVMLAY
jgi:hypothetical protein